VSSAKASFPPLQPPRRPPATTPPTLPPPPPPAPPPPLFPGLTPPMQPPSDLATPDGRFFCTRLEVTSSFTPDSSRREPPTYLRNQFGIWLLFIYRLLLPELMIRCEPFLHRYLAFCERILRTRAWKHLTETLRLLCDATNHRYSSENILWKQSLQDASIQTLAFR